MRFARTLLGVWSALACVGSAAAGAQAPAFRLVSWRQDHRELQLDRSFIAEPLRIGSKTYERGLGTHANSLIEIALTPACQRFLADVGADLNEPTRKAGGSVAFIVRVDGKDRFRSAVLQPGMEPVAVSVDLAGARKLELVADTATNGYIGDHADWANARIVLADRRELQLSEAFRRQGLPATAAAMQAPDLAEPETRTLSEEEAQSVLERDWLFQADQNPTPARIAQEIAWAREMAARVEDRLKAELRTPDLARELAALADIEKRAAEGREPPEGGTTNADLYLAVRRVKRQILLSDPAVDFSQVVFVDVPNWYPHESMHKVWPLAQENCGRLLVLDGLHPGGKLRKLAGPEPGMFWRPDVSFDGRKVLFCYRPKPDRVFHIYEIGVDGSGLRQVTSGSYDDLDPIYLPDGNIAFMTNRGNSYARCAVGHPSPVLARCDANGRNLYLISASNEPEYTPALLHNGRILYTRWEYTDKELMRIQSLWTVNPDGTAVSVFWGNQSYWPDMQLEARPIPGSHRVMFAGHGHHEVFLGSVGILDPKLGFNYPDGLTKVTADVAWPEVGNGPAERAENPRYHASGRFIGYKSPYPLSEELFLVSARPAGGVHKLYLMDTLGNRELIYEGAFHVLYAQPIRPRPKPPVVPDTVAWPGSEREGHPVEPGVVYSPNAFDGLPAAVREKAKYIRVINLDYTTFTYGLKTQGYSHWGGQPHMHAGPPISITCNDGFKRILGTVPIEADGSVSIEVPPCKQLHFQIVDEHGRALQTMRSFANVMPGERRGCLGCHEMHSAAPAVKHGGAAWKPPVKPTPPPWGASYSLGYERDIQPILDKHCGKCHQGDGKGRAKLDLTLRPSKDAGAFPEPYVTLTLGARRSFPGSFIAAEGGIAGTILAENQPWRPKDYATLPPMTTLSYTSKLIDIAMGRRFQGCLFDVKVDPLSLQKLIAWVDILCPYLGEPEIRSLPDPDPTDPRFANSDYPPRTPGVKPFTDSPYPPRLQNAPVVHRAYCQDDFPTQADRLKGR